MKGYRAESPLVLGLPRGGVPVAYEVARALGAPLDVWVVRKVGAPGHEELGLGAVAEGGVLFLDRGMMRSLGFSEAEVRQVAERAADEVTARVARFRGSHPRRGSRGVRSSWWTTAWPREARCARPSGH
ncbi:hypothetical protein ACN28S_30400 [Cystobacter fuscus]